MNISYLEAHNIIRGITGYGEGKGPYIAIHDGFTGISSWAGFLSGSDRIILDTHPYFAFSGQKNDAPITAQAADGKPGGIWPAQACNAWGPGMNTRLDVRLSHPRRSLSFNAVGPPSVLRLPASSAMVSQICKMTLGSSLIWVTGYNDCGLFLKGTGSYTPSYGDCTEWNDWASWDQATKDGVLNFALASMDALGDFFFWTWKVCSDMFHLVRLS